MLRLGQRAGSLRCSLDPYMPMACSLKNFLFSSQKVLGLEAFVYAVCHEFVHLAQVVCHKFVSYFVSTLAHAFVQPNASGFAQPNTPGFAHAFAHVFVQPNAYGFVPILAHAFVQPNAYGVAHAFAHAFAHQRSHGVVQRSRTVISAQRFRFFTSTR